MNPGTTHLRRGCLPLLITTSMQLNINIKTASIVHAELPKSACLLLPQAIGSGLNSLRLPEQPWTIENFVIPTCMRVPHRLFHNLNALCQTAHRTEQRATDTPMKRAVVLSRSQSHRVLWCHRRRTLGSSSLAFCAPPIDRALLHLSSRNSLEASH